MPSASVWLLFWKCCNKVIFFFNHQKSFNVGVERDVVTSGAQVAMWPMMIVTVTNFSLGSTVEPLNTDTRRYSGTPGDP